MKVIESLSNPLIKVWKSLDDNRSIKKSQLILVSGQKIISELLALNTHTLESLVFHEENTLSEFAAANGATSRQCVLVTKAIFKELDGLKTNSPIAILKKPEIKALPEDGATQKGLHLYCALGDPGNLGALIRSAEAFNAASVILLQESCNPFLPKVTKAASGSNLRVNLHQGPSITELKGEFCALDMDGTPIKDFSPKSSTINLLLGEEGLGVPDINCQKISIPMSPAVESLNATVAASIALYELSHK